MKALRVPLLIGLMCAAMIGYFILLGVRNVADHPGLTIGIEPLMGL